MSLRFGYVSNGLSDHRLEDALELLAENGYSGVALTLDHIHFDPLAPRLRARAARLRTELEALGMDAVVETGARFVLDPRRKHFPTLVSDGRQRRVDLLCTAVDVAAELGAPVVSMWSGAAPPNEPRELAWDLLVDGCERVLAHADDHGITLAFEPEPGMLVETLADYELLQSASGHPPALGPDARHRAHRLPGADVGHRVRPARRAHARARPHRGHEARRARAPGVRRRASWTSTRRSAC